MARTVCGIHDYTRSASRRVPLRKRSVANGLWRFVIQNNGTDSREERVGGAGPCRIKLSESNKELFSPVTSSLHTPASAPLLPPPPWPSSPRSVGG